MERCAIAVCEVPGMRELRPQSFRPVRLGRGHLEAVAVHGGGRAVSCCAPASRPSRSGPGKEIGVDCKFRIDHPCRSASISPSRPSTMPRVCRTESSFGDISRADVGSCFAALRSLRCMAWTPRLNRARGWRGEPDHLAPQPLRLGPLARARGMVGRLDDLV